PGCRRTIGHLPGAEIITCAEQHDGVSRCGNGSFQLSCRGNDRWLRTLSVMNTPLPIWLHRRVVIADRRLLSADGGEAERHDDCERTCCSGHIKVLHRQTSWSARARTASTCKATQRPRVHLS